MLHVTGGSVKGLGLWRIPVKAFDKHKYVCPTYSFLDDMPGVYTSTMEGSQHANNFNPFKANRHPALGANHFNCK